ncbi:MAG: FprA family A-type flavoprotein [Bacilli bacterium]|jgi:flavorubredoxin|nr:FprA family A-type flavoprotein [Bacilli bacterium]
MQTLELKKDFYYVGVIDHALKVFDVAVRTDEGTSYNSYLLKTSEGFVLFDGNKEVFADEYLANIEEIAPLSAIRYLFVAHTEPDHSGAIEALLEKNPDITVVASRPALMNLDKIIRRPFRRIQMNPASPLKIGGYTFRFVSGLLLHWPDVMFTYIEELRTLVSCDAFGAHFASDAILLSKEPDKERYYKAVEYYFAHIMAPFASYVKAAIERVKALEIDMICPGHGPVVDTDVGKQIGLYEKFAAEYLPVSDPRHVSVVYASAYGYTEKMALYLKRRFEGDGFKVSFHKIDALNYAETKPLILEDIRTSGLVLLGSPTLVGDAIGLFYDLLTCIPWTEGQGKKASAFGDYGWSGEAVAHLSERLRQLRFQVIEGYRACFKMSGDDEKALAAYFDRLASAKQ